MMKAEKAIAIGRGLLGTPYSELDCINLIKRILREGGHAGYTTAGTNSLWNSLHMTRKYRDLTRRQTGTDGARAGMLAFKIRGEDVHHVGLVTEAGTVIHSSSAAGCVVETALDKSWDALAVHRYIQTAEPVQAEMQSSGETAAAREGRRILLIDEAGNRFEPEGDFRVLIGGVD